MNKAELRDYFKRYHNLNKEWDALYELECAGTKVSHLMRQCQNSIDAIVDEVAFKFGIKD